MPMDIKEKNEAIIRVESDKNPYRKWVHKFSIVSEKDLEENERILVYGVKKKGHPNYLLKKLPPKMPKQWAPGEKIDNTKGTI